MQKRPCVMTPDSNPEKVGGGGCCHHFMILSKVGKYSVFGSHTCSNCLLHSCHCLYYAAVKYFSIDFVVIFAVGGPQVRFSIGASDRQALQPPLSSTLPVSRNTSALLFQQLGKIKSS